MFMFSGRHLCGPYLQVAGGRHVVDLDIGGVNVRQLEAVSQPRNRHIAGVSQHFTADVGWVALPRVHRYWSQDFRGICDERQSIYNWNTNKPAGSADPLSTYRPSTSAKGEQNLHSNYLWNLNSEDKVVKDQNVHGLNIELKAEFLKHSALRCWTHLFVAVHKSQSRFIGFKRPLLQAASLNSMHRGLLQARSSWRGPVFPHRLCANNCRPAEILFSHSSEIQMSLVPSHGCYKCTKQVKREAGIFTAYAAANVKTNTNRRSGGSTMRVKMGGNALLAIDCNKKVEGRLVLCFWFHSNIWIVQTSKLVHFQSELCLCY